MVLYRTVRCLRKSQHLSIIKLIDADKSFAFGRLYQQLYLSLRAHSLNHVAIPASSEDSSMLEIIRKSSTGLLRTCKQINTEATDILYGANTFTFAEMMHPVAANSNLESP